MPRLRYRSKTPGSRLEEQFLLLWRETGGPELEREFRFHDKRRWRADFAHLENRSLIEIEGDIWVNGRTTGPSASTPIWRNPWKQA